MNDALADLSDPAFRGQAHSVANALCQQFCSAAKLKVKLEGLQRDVAMGNVTNARRVELDLIQAGKVSNFQLAHVRESMGSRY